MWDTIIGFLIVDPHEQYVFTPSLGLAYDRGIEKKVVLTSSRLSTCTLLCKGDDVVFYEVFVELVRDEEGHKFVECR